MIPEYRRCRPDRRDRARGTLGDPPRSDRSNREDCRSGCRRGSEGGPGDHPSPYRLSLRFTRYLGHGIQHPHVLAQAAQAVYRMDAGVQFEELLVDFPLDMPPGVPPGIGFNQCRIRGPMKWSPLWIEQMQAPLDCPYVVAVRKGQIHQQRNGLELVAHVNS